MKLRTSKTFHKKHSSNAERIRIFKLKGEEERLQMVDIYENVYCPAKYGRMLSLEEGETQQLICVCSQIGAGKSHTIRKLKEELQKQYGETIAEIDTDSCKPFTPVYIKGRKADMEARARGEHYAGGNYTRASAPQSDYLKQLALDDVGRKKDKHVLYEFAVRNSSREKIEESLRSFDSDTDRRAIVLAIPGVVSATSVFARAEDDYDNKNKVYIPAEIDVHDESYEEMPEIVEDAVKNKYIDQVIITDREGRVLFDSQTDKTESLSKEIKEKRDLYFSNHPEWKKELKDSWDRIFESMKKRNAHDIERIKAKRVRDRIEKESIEIEQRLRPQEEFKEVRLDQFVRKTRFDSMRSIVGR